VSRKTMPGALADEPGRKEAKLLLQSLPPKIPLTQYAPEIQASIEFFKRFTDQAAQYPPFTSERWSYVREMQDTWRAIESAEHRRAIYEWTIAHGLPEMLEFGIFGRVVEQSSEDFRCADDRLSVWSRCQSICGALVGRRTPQLLDQRFFDLLEAVLSVNRVEFNHAVSSLMAGGHVRVLSGRYGLAMTLSSKEARREGRGYRARYLPKAYQKPEDFRHGAEHVEGIKTNVMLPMVERLGVLRMTQRTMDFFDEWDFSYSSGLVRTLVAEMVFSGQLKPCIIDGLPGVTI
jgi:hypothetical protein